MQNYQQLMQVFSGLGGMTLVWVQLGLAGLLTAVICWRRQAIVRIGSFRRSFFWLSMSFIIPAVLNMLTPLLMNYFDSLSSAGMGGRNANPLGGAFGLFYGFANSIPPLLVGVSILFLSRAIVPSFIPPEDTHRVAAPQRPVDTFSE
jgi:hypothetical protein